MNLNGKKTLVTVSCLDNLIYEIRGQKVMIDTDLARVYEIPTFRLNEAVKRNCGRFPEDFMFQLTSSEFKNLTSQIAMSRQMHGGRRTLPYVFTEHGAVMAANILNSPRAVQLSVFVVRAFIRMREAFGDSRGLARKLVVMERELKKRLNVHESVIVDILQRMMDIIDPPLLPEPPHRRIGFRIDEKGGS
jgi:hypothetical protein